MMGRRQRASSAGRYLFSPDQLPAWRSPQARLMSAALCWLEAGSSPGQGCMHACCPTSATYCVEHGAQQELLAWMCLINRLVYAAVGKQGWQKGDIYGRSMSFAGCLFHTWKQTNIVLIPETCKPSSVLCHYVQLPGWGTSLDEMLQGAL